MSSVEIFLDETLGAAFIGLVVSSTAFGVTLSQVAWYLSRYPRDKLVIKTLVVGILGLEIGHQVLISHALYYYDIRNFARPGILIGSSETVIWSLIAQQALGAVIGFIVKMCFATRVWRFSKHDIIVSGILAALNIAEFVLSLVFTYKCFKLDKLMFLPQIKILGSFALGCGALTDLLLAGALCFYLQRLQSKHRRHHKDMHGLITMLSIYAISTGMITSAVGIATLLCYYFMASNFIFIALYFLLTKLYGVSLFAALNTRQHIEDEVQSRISTQPPHGATDSLTSLPLRRLKQQSAYSRHRTSRASSAHSKTVLRHADYLSSTQLGDHDPGTSSNLQLPVPSIPKISWDQESEANISRFSHLTE